MNAKEQYVVYQEPLANKTKKTPMKSCSLFVFILLVIYFIITSYIFLKYACDTYFRDYEIDSYDEIKDSLANGDKLRIVMDYSKMTYYSNGTKVEPPNEKSGFDVEDYKFFGRTSNKTFEYIQVSFTKMSVYPAYLAIYEYGTISFFTGGFFDISVYLYKANNFTFLESKRFTGPIQNGGLQFSPQTPRYTKYF